VINIVAPIQYNKITDLGNNQQVTGESRKPGLSYIEKNRKDKNVYSITIKPHSFRVFKLQ
jgi:hypothetical protein